MRREKRRIRKELRRWRREGKEGDTYKKLKRKYKELCKRKNPKRRVKMG